MMTIQTSALNTLTTIIFRNTSRNAVDAIICCTQDAAIFEENRLRGLRHIEVLAVTEARVVPEAR